MVERIAHWLSASGASGTSSEAVSTGSEHKPESVIDQSSSQIIVKRGAVPPSDTPPWVERDTAAMIPFTKTHAVMDLDVVPRDVGEDEW